jgi:hypothetical protein
MYQVHDVTKTEGNGYEKENYEVVGYGYVLSHNGGERRGI